MFTVKIRGSLAPTPSARVATDRSALHASTAHGMELGADSAPLALPIRGPCSTSTGPFTPAFIQATHFKAMYASDPHTPDTTAPAPREARRVGNTPERYLVVDDNQDIARTMALMLEQNGRIARAALNGEEALRAGWHFLPDVILLDLVMPRLDGFETCRRMREQAWGATARIIAFTGWSSDVEYSRAKEAGFDGFLVKPISSIGLRDLLEGRIPNWEDRPFWRYRMRSSS